ncbi:hypothetical protein [Sulfurimonas sp.]
MKMFLLSTTATLLFTGCSYLSIGDRTSSLCDGDCNYKEAGVCADTITIYKHRRDLVNRKTKEHWFAKDEDPYYEDPSSSSFTPLNEEDIYDK